MKRYQIIYADPPWSYNDTQQSGGTAYFGAIVRYDTMSLERIKALPIAQITDNNCVLFLWATSPLLPEALEVIKSWGFNFKTIAFCWNKIESEGYWVSNLGRWTMGNIELCLLGVKGNPKRISENIKQLVVAQRSIHSKKPDEVRKRIVELMGELPRIELFARDNGIKDMFGYNRMEGWDCWGNEVESDIEL